MTAEKKETAETTTLKQFIRYLKGVQSRYFVSFNFGREQNYL